jgi:membrane fusion protein (multidrug efflux system)
MKKNHTMKPTYQVSVISVIASIAVLLLLFICSCASGPEQHQASAEMPTAQVIAIDTSTTLTYKDYSGVLEGKVNVEIRPQVDGYLDKVFIDEGAFVEEGQALFRISQLPYIEQLNQAQANFNAAEAALLTAQLEVEKVTPLVQNKVVSEIQLKTVQAAQQVAKAHVAQAKAAVASAQINLDFTTIKAPVSGYIGRLPKKAGSLVGRADQQPLTVLSDVHEVYAYFAMGESDFIRFKAAYPGISLQDKISQLPPVSLILADNGLYSQQGKIDMIDGQFDKNTGAITLRASFVNPQGLLRSGNTGKVRLGQVHRSAIVVPQEATVEIQDKVFVYAVRDSNKVYKQPLTILGKSGTNYLVGEGLKAGDRIVFSNLAHLQEGGKIIPKTVTADNRKK